ncbi:MAG: hypothetical protein IT378_05940 [Sandaracinaceae bacterium]|nr:hypothetical protein [Sandaracinaceae bacterium]
MPPTSTLPPRAFRTKGLAYRNVLAFLDLRLGGRERLLESFEEPGLRAFFAQPFLAASWYDTVPIGALCEAGAKHCGVSVPDFIREHTRNQAREDLGGVYRVILKVFTPELALRALIKVTERYYDFGTTEIVELHAGRAVTVRTDLPDAIFDWYAIVADEYTRAVLEHAGAKDIRVRSERGKRGLLHGMPTSQMRFEIDWR